MKMITRRSGGIKETGERSLWRDFSDRMEAWRAVTSDSGRHVSSNVAGIWFDMEFSRLAISKSIANCFLLLVSDRKATQRAKAVSFILNT
jgi:hypothetical protein